MRGAEDMNRKKIGNSTDGGSDTKTESLRGAMNCARGVDVLKKEGIKRTQGRNAVLRILTELDKPMTYDEIFLCLIQQHVSINVSTVYRILEAFAAKGIVTKINGGEHNRSLYELARQEHRHYFFCVNCRGLFPIRNCPVHSLVEDLKDTMEFEVMEHKLELTGVCRECKALTKKYQTVD